MGYSNHLENQSRSVSLSEEEQTWSAHVRSRLRDPLQQLVGDPAGLLGWVILVTVILMALAAPAITPHDPLQQNIASRLLPPFWIRGNDASHILGTDQLGRDILSRIIYSSRISLLVGVTTVIMAGALGVFAGILSGYYGGLLDEVIMRTVDVRLSIPLILLLIAILAIFGPGLRNVIIVLAATEWVVYARVVRAEVFSIREREFVEAARASGASDRRIMLRHILPNAISSAIVLASVQVGAIIILESSLSFLGLGVLPPTPTWGNMLGEGRDYLITSWWLATFPGLMLAITVLSINLVGDWLRDWLDPKMG